MRGAPPGTPHESPGLRDLKANTLLLTRTVTLRGNTGEVYRHAAAFVGEIIREARAVR